MNQDIKRAASGGMTGSGAPHSRENVRLTLAEAIIEAIRQEMQDDPSVIYLGQDVGVFGGVMQGTRGLYDEFGRNRVLETPISESAMVGIGLGAALFGMKPIVEVSFGEFLPAAMNQLINQAPNLHYMTGGAKSAPAVIRTRAGHGPYGGHPQDYSVWFCHVPGIKVVMPANPSDAYRLMRAAIRDPNPVLFVEPMSLSHGRREQVDLTESIGPETIGSARIAHAGKDLTLVAYGSQLPLVQRASQRAEAEHGVSVEIIDLRSLAPWDVATVVQSVRRTRRLLTVHEAWKGFGHGAEVIARVLEELGPDSEAVRVGRVGAKPVPIPSGPLRGLALPDEKEIHTAIMNLARSREAHIA
ncbi:alpha-ketoacid dehydrogenase subunit beta [Candidimonas nitroreducens]|uniref:Alpha-ketoacid dehydrogenase subunit beta n=1 Tax=Candidimonas nitroreducens TaxID=683354 RepID=A0A225MTX8_9BURK|nr:transketolase C-terminal domain-containing protein [Candidimonas nitroreducens]OWT62099.1 alpha-ketoacid dehydrogenase subunit beta [Candidimonas nitroreducens]